MVRSPLRFNLYGEGVAHFSGASWKRTGRSGDRGRIVQPHNAGSYRRNTDVREHKGLAVQAIETAGNSPRELEMLALVFPYGHLLGLIQQNISSLENGIVQESGAHTRLVRRFLLILCHPLQPAYRGYTV
jgi:hypothetical protein